MKTDKEIIRGMRQEHDRLIEAGREVEAENARLQDRMEEAEREVERQRGRCKNTALAWSHAGEMQAERDGERALAERRKEALRLLKELCRGHNARGSDGPCGCDACRFLAGDIPAQTAAREAVLVVALTRIRDKAHEYGALPAEIERLADDELRLALADTSPAAEALLAQGEEGDDSKQDLADFREMVSGQWLEAIATEDPQMRRRHLADVEIRRRAALAPKEAHG